MQCRPAEPGNELAPFHSITSSARTRMPPRHRRLAVNPRHQFLIAFLIKCCPAQARYGSLPDIAIALGNVRFTSHSGHHWRLFSCPLSAKSGSRAVIRSVELIVQPAAKDAVGEMAVGGDLRPLPDAPSVGCIVGPVDPRINFGP
jgi:hypothetical protein